MWWALTAPTAAAGVWVREPGASWLQVSASAQTSTRLFDEAGAARPQASEPFLGSLAGLFSEGRLLGVEAGLYAEVGVARGLELIGALPVRAVSNRWSFARGPSEDLVQDNLGFGDATLGGRAGGPVGRFALSGHATVRLPLYDNGPDRLNLEAGNADFYDDRVPLGPGTIDLDLGGGAGTGLGLADGWTLVEAGVRLRDRGYSTALPGRLQAGVHPAPPVATWLELDGLVSLGDGEAPDFFRDPWGKGPVVIDHASWSRASLGASVALGRGFVLLGTVSRVLAARRFPLLTGASLGLARQTPTEAR